MKKRANVVVEGDVEAKERHKGNEEEEISDEDGTLIDQLHLRVAADVWTSEHSVEVQLAQTVVEGQSVGHADVHRAAQVEDDLIVGAHLREKACNEEVMINNAKVFCFGIENLPRAVPSK